MHLVEKIRSNGLLNPTVLSVVQHLSGRKIKDERELPWLECISFLSFLHGGHTAFPKDPERIFQLIQQLFVSREELLHPFLAAELSVLFDMVIQDLDRGAWKKWGEDESDQHILLPFSKNHDRALCRELYRLAHVLPAQRAEASLTILGSLHPEQKAAVEMALAHPVCLIQGGPGTGKTHTAGVLVAILAAQFQASCGIPPYRVLTTAPTGKATFHLKASIERRLAALQLQSEHVEIEAMTLHAFLLQAKNPRKKGQYHTIIVDESSMIDTKLMSDVMGHISTGTRVVMLGDPHQLPPIQPGRPFFDMLQASEKMKGMQHGLKAARLTHCQRTDLQGIVRLAEATLRGDREEFFAACNSAQEASFAEEKEDAECLSNRLSEKVLPLWEDTEDLSIDEALERSLSLRILTPSRSMGAMSATALNDVLDKKRGRHGRRMLRPILITKNQYALECMNGDVGIRESLWGRHKMHIPSSSHSPFSESLCSDYELAYAMTIHKSQGSEFHTALVLIPERSALLSRELLYTAITRAKKRVEIVGSRVGVQQALERVTERHTLLCDLLVKEFSRPFTSNSFAIQRNQMA